MLSSGARMVIVVGRETESTTSMESSERVFTDCAVRSIFSDGNRSPRMDTTTFIRMTITIKPAVNAVAIPPCLNFELAKMFFLGALGAFACAGAGM